jgi:hypothetical protein
MLSYPQARSVFGSELFVNEPNFLTMYSESGVIVEGEFLMDFSGYFDVTD